MASSSQYRSDRRVSAVKAVDPVRSDAVMVKDDLQLRGKFRQALARAADALHAEQQRRAHTSFAEADARHGGHSDSGGQSQKQETAEAPGADQDERERRTAPVVAGFEAHVSDSGESS